MLQVIKHIFYMIKMLINVISRLTGSNVCKTGNRRLYGYIYTAENMLTGTLIVGSSISINKVRDIERTYYSHNIYNVRIIHKSCNSTHKDRRNRLKELQDYYINKYSKQYKVVMLI